MFLGAKKRLYKRLCPSNGRSDGWMVRLHHEILRNLLTLKTGYVKIASCLGFGIDLVFFFLKISLNLFRSKILTYYCFELFRCHLSIIQTTKGIMNFFYFESHMSIE
jgi:hypothetical protein